jgi:hypothetical protein
VLSVFIGYDPVESIAFYTLSHSILRRSSIPVSIAPVARNQLKDVYTRKRGPTESTDFSLTRFLVPWLSGFKGWSLYMDCDMLCRADISKLAAAMAEQPDKALLVCKHDYVPSTARKFLDRVQTTYPRKNWSSLMAFNTEFCKALTPEYVNSASPPELHRFSWLEDRLIGELPLEWNWLVGEYAYNPAAKIVHFTIGGPYFDEYRGCDYAAEWFAEYESMRQCAPSKEKP